MSYFFPVFTCFFLFLLWFNFSMNKNNHKTEKIQQSFWERERQADNVRKVPLEKIPFLSIPLETFPIGRFQDDILLECEEILLSLKEKHILNLTGKTTTELKEEYGAANLALLDECDENYVLLVKTLARYGTRLNELGKTAECVTVLEFGISVGTDISANYHLLAEIYQKQQCTDKIQNLLTLAKNLNSLMSASICRDLQSFL